MRNPHDKFFKETLTRRENAVSFFREYLSDRIGGPSEEVRPRTPQISDISALAGLSALRWLLLNNNQISDISPLVNNTGISGSVYLSGNPLDTASCTGHIPELEGRGITVNHDCP